MTTCTNVVATLVGRETPWLDASGRHGVRAKLRTSMTTDLAVDVEAGLGDVPDYAIQAVLLRGAAVIHAAASDYVQGRRAALTEFAAAHVHWLRRHG